MDWASVLLAPPAPEAPPGPRPDVSVLVPVYNAAGTVAAALESVLAQSPPPHQVLVSDDGSQDDLDPVLAPYRRWITVLRGDNRGPGTARNRAAALATGQLLAMCDADDVWLPGRLDALATAAQLRPDLAVLTTDAWLVRPGTGSTERYYATRAFPIHAQRHAVLGSNFVLGAGAVRRDAFRGVGGYHPAARHAEDWDLFLQLILRGARAGLVTVPLYEYRRRPDSLTSQRVDLAVGVLRALDRARPLLADRHERRLLRATCAQWRVRAGKAAVRSGDARRRPLALRAALAAGTPPAERLRLMGGAVLPGGVLAAHVARR